MKGGSRQGSVNARELVLDALMSIVKEEEYSHVVIGGILDKYNYLETQEKAFIKRLTEGTLERRTELDYCIDSVSSLPVKKMKPLIRELLRMGAYQILYMDAVPDSAVCNEAVKLAGRRGFSSLKGFVNGVLRSLCRNKESIVYPDRAADRRAYLSIRYSMPRWIIEKWDREQGQENTELILQGLLEEKPVTVRFRNCHEDGQTEAVRQELAKGNVRAVESGILPCAFYLERTEGMKNIPAFVSGRITVQDVSSMLAVEGAGIHPEDYVMDLCAAPGGKAIFAAEKAYRGQVLARDVSAGRLSLLEETVGRLGIENLTLQQWDATDFDPEKEGVADVVLVDAPCSGLGVIGKKRDIKYRITPKAIEEVALLQKRILEQASRYVKPGGVLLYSTCTISQAENGEIRRWFLERFPFREDSLEPYLPKACHSGTTGQGYIQFLPGVHGMDGFFIARFVRE